MDFYIVSNQKIFEKKLDHLNMKMQFIKSSQFRKTIKACYNQAVFYLDIESFDNWEKEFKYALKYDYIFLAVIDFHHKIKNLSPLIFNGVVDYLGRDNSPEDINVKHLAQLQEYLEKYRYDYQGSDEESADYDGEDYIITEDGWHSIQSGQEYSFYIMYIELDGITKLEKSFAKSNLKVAIESFKKFVEQNVMRFDGKIWLWQGFGGIILFPFNGEDCPSALSGYRMALYKHLHDVEDSPFPHFLSYRMAIHLGNLVYQFENTGNVIADTLNSTFHLGGKFAEPGNFYITEDVFRYVHPKIRSYFVGCGDFEGRNIWRMRRPILGALKD